MSTTTPANRETPSKPDPLKSSRETAGYLKVSVATLDRWASVGIGPRFFKVGKHRRYRLEDIDGWLDARVREQGGRR